MIRILINQRNSVPISRLKSAPAALSGLLSVHSYQRVFSRGNIPAGTLVFTDLDLLHSYEVDAAAVIAKSARKKFRHVKIINDPSIACERFALLSRLHAAV